MSTNNQSNRTDKLSSLTRKTTRGENFKKLSAIACGVRLLVLTPKLEGRSSNFKQRIRLASWVLDLLSPAQRGVADRAGLVC